MPSRVHSVSSHDRDTNPASSKANSGLFASRSFSESSGTVSTAQATTVAPEGLSLQTKPDQEKPQERRLDKFSLLANSASPTSPPEPPSPRSSLVQRQPMGNPGRYIPSLGQSDPISQTFKQGKTIQRKSNSVLASPIPSITPASIAQVQRLMSAAEFNENAKRKGVKGIISNWTATTRPTIANLLKEYEIYAKDNSLKSKQRQIQLLNSVLSISETWINERYDTVDAEEVELNSFDDEGIEDWRERAQEELEKTQKIDKRSDTDDIMAVIVRLVSECGQKIYDLQVEIDDELDQQMDDESGEGSESEDDSEEDNYMPNVPKKEQEKLKKLQAKNKKDTKFIQKRLEGNPDSVFGKILPPILDTVMVPSIGDKSKLEVIITFPVAVEPHSATTFGIGGRVMLDAERKEDEQIKVLFEGALRGAVNIAGGLAKANVELGVYFEAQARSSKEVGQLLSYALYQRFRESSMIPEFATNMLWGGNSGGLGESRANKWAGAVEKNVFGAAAKGKEKDTYIETGGFGGVGAEGGIGDVAKLKGGVKGYSGVRYDTDSLVKTGKLTGEAGKYELGETAEKTVGKGAYRLELAASAKIGPAQIDGKFKLETLAEAGHYNKGMGFHKWELDSGGEVTVPGSGALATITTLLLSSEQLVTTISNQLNEAGKSDSSRTRQVGGAVSELLSSGKAIGSIATNIPGADAITSSLSNLGTTGLRLRVKPSKDAGKPLKIEVYIYVAHNIGLPEGIGGGVVDVSAKFSQWKRLAYFKYQDGNWTLESLGLSMEVKKDKDKDGNITKETTKFKGFGEDTQVVEEKDKDTGETTKKTVTSKGLGEKLKDKNKKK